MNHSGSILPFSNGMAFFGRIFVNFNTRFVFVVVAGSFYNIIQLNLHIKSKETSFDSAFSTRRKNRTQLDKYSFCLGVIAAINDPSRKNSYKRMKYTSSEKEERQREREKNWLKKWVTPNEKMQWDQRDFCKLLITLLCVLCTVVHAEKSQCYFNRSSLSFLHTHSHSVRCVSCEKWDKNIRWGRKRENIWPTSTLLNS